MAEATQTHELQPALERARGRWLSAAMVNAGGRWAVLAALPAALVALVFTLSGSRDLVLLASLSVLALFGIVAAVALTRRVYARGRRVGAPDWSLQLDRELGLNDALVTLLDGAGPFAKAVQARVAAHFDETRARKAAPRKQWGALLVALLLALMPLALWSPTSETPLEDEIAQGDSGSREAPAAGEAAGSVSGSAQGAEKGGKAKDGARKGGDGAQADNGETKASQPAASGRKSDAPGEPPPKDARPTPAQGAGQAPRDGESTGSKPQPEAAPEKPVDSNDRAIKPDVGEGERRTKDTSKYVYDPDGEKQPGTEASGPNWKEKAEDSIPRMKLTSRERKLLEEWFNRVGR